jgi:high affinity Mn2+ porin
MSRTVSIQYWRVQASVVTGVSPRTALLVLVAAAGVSAPMPTLDAQRPRPRSAAAGDSAPEAWSGLSIGGDVGYGQGTARAMFTDPRVAEGHVFGRLEGGMHLGAAWVVAPRFVLGAEADISVPEFFDDGAVLATTTAAGTIVTEKIDFVPTLRGRAGYVFNRWMIYGTGGVAPSQTRFIESSATNSDEDHILMWRAGWTVGAGVEFAITPGWVARVEYRYDALGRTGASFPLGPTVQSTASVHSLRVGLSRRLGWPGAHSSTRISSRAVDTVSTASAVSSGSERWNVHGQDTFIEQGYFAFRSPYEGTNSLAGNSQAKNTESATAFVGVRLWHGAEFYVNPEIDQGFGLNDTHGVSAFPNGEAQKASFPMPRLVIDRLIVRQTFGLGGEQESVADGPNQLAGVRDIARVTVVVGRLAVTDYFDGNSYANDPRTNFMNWNIYGAGAYDWTMDQLSWTWGALAELNQKRWALRAGYFLLPTVSSTNTFDTHIPGRGQFVLELERRYAVFSELGAVRLFGWVNHGTMGGYAAAVAEPVSTPNYPDITLTRQVRTNPGVVLNVEQAITDDVGLFSRASWSPGRVEILGGTDCSESLTLGTALQGRRWGRPNDAIGLAGVVGGLSPVARAYFAAGGLGILIGDGHLNYRTERALEAYYMYGFAKWLALSVDYQFIINPGYNADRGPVSIYAIRLHTAF